MQWLTKDGDRWPFVGLNLGSLATSGVPCKSTCPSRCQRNPIIWVDQKKTSTELAETLQNAAANWLKKQSYSWPPWLPCMQNGRCNETKRYTQQANGTKSKKQIFQSCGGKIPYYSNTANSFQPFIPPMVHNWAFPSDIRTSDGFDMVRHCVCVCVS